jgi:small GTP-binding protein
MQVIFTRIGRTVLTTGTEKPLFHVKVILAGDGTVGKTCLLHRYMFNEFVETHKMTIGMDSHTKLTKVPGLGPVKIHTWDLAGQMQWAVVRESFYLVPRHGFGFDVNNWKPLNICPNWVSECRIKAPGIPVLVVANKVDLPFRIPVDKIARWARDNHYDYIETSPKTGQNVSILFEKLGLMGVNFALKSR